MAPNPETTPTKNARQHARGGTALFALMLAGVVLGGIGCQSMWDRHRESERMFALDNARTHTQRGQCAKALSELDRAQARIDLGPYARESTRARARCYDKLELNEMAAAHRRMIQDFYTEEPLAYPEADGSSIFRVRSVPSGGFDRPPSWLKIAAPRYPEYARRSKITGRVVVSFELAGNDTPRAIRVLEMPHPLLATLAIEAIAQAKPRKKAGAPELMPGGRFVTTFAFEYRWAKEVPQEDLDS